jgi:aerobic carbon-monoxide dehydrogenase small subunit
MHLVVNGLEHEIRSDGLTSLLRVLREELYVMSPKAGCEQGGCGACTVLVDGEPRRACLTPVAAIDGAAVTTVEGLSDGVDLAPIQQAFHDHYAAQCGFCSPGMMMAATALLEHTVKPSREQIIDALEGHLCRCTGYVKILDAVESVAKGGK